MNSAITEYSEALFALSLEEKTQDKILSDLECVGEVFITNPEFVDYISCVSIPKDERVSALENTFIGKIENHTLYTLCILCERNRMKEFSEFFGGFKALYEASKHISTAKILSAAPLSDGEKSSIKEKLTELCGHDVVLECEIDKTLLGGFVATVDGKIFDASLKSQLQGIKDVINR